MMGAERRSMVMTEDEKEAHRLSRGGPRRCRPQRPAARSDPQGDDHPARPGAWAWFMCSARARPAVGELHQVHVQDRDGDGRHVSPKSSCSARRTSPRARPRPTSSRPRSIARAMVTQFGFSEELGYVDYANEQDSYLGNYGGGTNHSSETQKLIDDKVKEIVDTGYRTAKRVLTEKAQDLEILHKDFWNTKR